MKLVQRAPNLVLATLWADMLSGVGLAATVQRAWASSITGEIPPDQSLPEVWVQDGADCDRARALLDEWQHLPHHHWCCQACREMVDGPFEQCWNCGALRPGGTGESTPHTATGAPS
jgi:hypothetical protein